MAVKTLYFKNAAPSGASTSLSLQDGGTAPTGAITATGWIVGTTAAGRTSAMLAGTKRAAATFTVSDSIPTFAANACWRTENPLTGIFANTVWNLNFRVRATSASTQSGSIKARIWKSTNPDGSDATQLTSALQAGGTTSVLSTSASATSVVAWNLGGAITLLNEYLWVECEWNTVAVGAAGNDVMFYVESAGAITTSDFAPSVAGLIAATEGGAETASFSGSVAWTGTLNVYEGTTAPTADSEAYYADSELVTADAVNPGDVATFAGQVLATGVSGALTATDVADTSSFVGNVAFPVRTGTLAVTEATADTSAFTGLVGRSGTLAATESVADVAAFTGTTGWAGTLAATEGASTASFAGTVAWPVLSGTITATEASQGTATFTGLVAWHGTLAATETTQDVFAATGTVANLRIGILDAVEASPLRADSELYTADDNITRNNDTFGGDTAEFRVFIPCFGSLHADEASDVAAFPGEVFDGVTRIGVLEAHEDRFPAGLWPTADSTAYTVDNSNLTADLYLFAGDDAKFSGVAVDLIFGALDASEDRALTADSTVYTADSSVTNDKTLAGSDLAIFLGTVPVVRGAMEVVEGADTAHFTDEYFAVLAAQEGEDVANFFYHAPNWEDLRGEFGLRNEIQRMVWLSGLGGRVTWLEGEVEDMSELENLNPEVVELVNEVQRIRELVP
jgi:hypothetical protein